MLFKTGVRVGLGVAAAPYFPIKFYWLDRYQPQSWVNLGVTAMFWATLIGFAILSERSNR
jgi:hypothetical protein